MGPNKNILKDYYDTFMKSFPHTFNKMWII